MNPQSKRIAVLLLAMLFVYRVSNAQEASPKPFKLKFGYSTNQIYNGRADSLEVPYLTGSLKFLDKSGFYVKSSLSYLTSPYAQRIDLIGLGVGYQKLFNEKYLVTASFDKSFYNSNSFSVSSSILGNLGASFFISMMWWILAPISEPSLRPANQIWASILIFRMILIWEMIVGVLNLLPTSI